MKRMLGAVLAFAAITVLTTMPKAASTQVPPSGLKLGANLFPVPGGLRVQYTEPGTPAARLLLPGDILTRASDGTWIYLLRTPGDMEAFKNSVGPGRYGVIEVYRRNIGTIYFWVSFTPVGGTQHYVNFRPTNGKSAAKKMFQGKKIYRKRSPRRRR